MDKFTGDGIMAVFGAPVALEDHAVRACLAALGIQEETERSGRRGRRRDGVELQLRVGLNSGQVIAGEIGSGPLGYTAIGEQVGYGAADGVGGPAGRGDAQRVHRAAGRGRRGAGRTGAGAHQGCRGAGARPPAAGRCPNGHRLPGVPKSSLVGRRLGDGRRRRPLLDRAIDGRGAVVGVVGPPGIGKSRLVREVAATGRRSRGRGVFRLLRIARHARSRSMRWRGCCAQASGVGGLDGEAARAQVRAGVPPTPIRRTCCCLMTCWASPTPRWRCPRSTRMRGGGG